jgi:L-alanine-DL-glutamate epimerase-like enolase superfamily enzyme
MIPMLESFSMGGSLGVVQSIRPVLPIRGFETVALRVPLARVYRGSNYMMSHRSTVLVTALGEDGVIGRAYVGDEDGSLGTIIRIINEEIAPRLIGEDALAIERCWELARPSTFDILRDRRLGLVATAAVDTVLWDALGKATGMPLWRVWGGFTNRLPVICAGAYYGSPTPIEDETVHLREEGFHGIKFKVGGLTPAEDAERVLRARRAVGPDFTIMVDANQGWLPRDAIRFAQLAEAADIFWFEEPCRWDNDRRAMRDVRFAAGIPVCAGQTEMSAAGCRDLMEAGAIDYCNFDASWSGGPTEWRRVAALAATYNVKMAHHEEPQVAAHLLASIPHGTFLEMFKPERDPIWWNLVANRPKLVDGFLTLPDEPGLGWELDEDYIEAHRIADEDIGRW